MRVHSMQLSTPLILHFQPRLVRIQPLLCFHNLTYTTGAINSSGIGVNYPYLRLARLCEESIWRRVKRVDI